MRQARLLFAALLLTLLPRVASADIESDGVRQGLAAYQRLEYGRAVELLTAALRESLTKEEKLVTYRTLGFAHVALDRVDEARADFERLLTVDPTVELDRRVSPRARAIFEEARTRLATRGPSRPAHHVPPLQPALEPAVPREGEPLSVTLIHPGGLVRRAELFHRTRGQAGFAQLGAPGSDDGVFHLVIPGGGVRPPALEYYAVLLDEGGAAVANAGTLGAPLGVEVRPRPVPVHRRRWFWGVLGAAAASALVISVSVGVALTAPATITIIPK